MLRSMRTACDIEAIFGRHFDTVYRLCYSYLGNAADAEDAAQSVFLKLVDKPRSFRSTEHEKAWLIVCASNFCKDVLKSAHRTKVVALPEYESDRMGTHDVIDDTIDAVLRLPVSYKDCVYLYYYEGYKTAEVAKMLGIPASTVRNRLRDARELLKRSLEGKVRP